MPPIRFATAEQIQRNNENLKTKNVLEFFNDKNCWERKKLINLKDGSVMRDIPIFTRLLIETPKLCFQYQDKQVEKLSRNQKEVMVSSLSFIQNATVIQCFTPITRQNFGCVVPENDSVIHFLGQCKEEKDSNCFLLINCIDDWQLQLYTTKHIKKNENLKLNQSVLNDSKDNQEKKTSFHFLHQFIPGECYYIIPKFETLLQSQRACILNSNYDNKEFSPNQIRKENNEIKNQWIQPCKLKKKVENWREFILFYCVRLLMNYNSELDYKFIQEEFVKAYGSQANENPILLTSFALEGSFNSKIDRKWYKIFTVKTMMALSQTSIK